MAKYIFLENKDGASNNRQLMKAIIQNGEIIGWQKVIKYPPCTLVDEDYVDEKIKESDPDFKGTFNSMSDIESITLVNANDWAYLRSLDENNNEVYSRYRYTREAGWVFEVSIKRDNFTDDEWAAITSGITSSMVERLGEIDELVGDQVLQSLDRDSDGNVIGIYKVIDDESEQSQE